MSHNLKEIHGWTAKESYRNLLIERINAGSTWKEEVFSKLVSECLMSQVFIESRKPSGTDFEYHLFSKGQTFILSSKAKNLSKVLKKTQTLPSQNEFIHGYDTESDPHFKHRMTYMAQQLLKHT